MAKADRKRIGFLMNNDDLGVIYYLSNIVQSLDYLDDEKKPVILLLFNESTQKHLSIFSEYPYIEEHSITYPNLFILYIYSFVRQENYFLNNLFEKYKLRGILPANDILFRSTSKERKMVAWITDFQHKFYPRLFGIVNRTVRNLRFKNAFQNANDVILSSLDSQSHLQKFYKKINAKIHVLNFVSHANRIVTANSVEILNKYNIQKPYFIVSNQFYKHKNHIVVLEAIKKMIEMKYLNFEVVFTGKKEDYRDKNFFPSIEKFIDINSLANYVKILGVIPRNEQIILFKNAEAAIQPSLFEGWNSSIEDAKTLNQQVICSDILVHHEQMSDRAFYFNPKDSLSLAITMLNMLTHAQNRLPIFDDFKKRVIKFASDFINIFDEN